MSELAELREGAGENLSELKRLGAGSPVPSSSSSSLRAWIVLLAGVSALAGFAAGLLVATQLGPDPEPQGAFARYREAIVQEFDLSPERERVLASVLDEYERQLEDLQARGLRPLGDEQAARGRRIHEMIRDRIIPSDQRDRFLELSSLETSPF